MKKLISSRTGMALALGLALGTTPAVAEDIDIFVGGTDAAGRPNILIVLDNTSNWARQSQKWPGGLQQGQSEVRAIKNALTSAIGRANVGILEFTTNGNANENGGFVRHHIRPLTNETKAVLDEKLDTIFANINSPTEKRNSNTPYGNLMYDAYNYFGGFSVYLDGAGTLGSIADGLGYTQPYSHFLSPLTDDSTCASAYIIFVSNPNSSGPATDEASNSTVLKSLIQAAGGTPARLSGDSSGNAIPIYDFVVNTVQTPNPAASLGTTSACYKTTQCDEAIQEFEQCSTTYETCECTTSGAKCSGNGANATYNMAISGYNTETIVTTTANSSSTKGGPWNFDDWAQFLYQYGVPFTKEDGTSTRVPVVTYTIDVFNAHQNADHTGLMMSGAKVGGGRYFAAKNEEQIETALGTILSEILAVNSSFASASLPVSATNRTQNENQVFIPMFRPDRFAKPRWYGNLKQYKIGRSGGELDLVDKNGEIATSSLTGFIHECAASFWTVDSSNYWQDKGVNPVPSSKCLVNPLGLNPYSDLPDGAFVEKGAASSVLRMGNGGAAGTLNRTVYTVGSSGSLAPFTTANAPSLSADLVSFIFGHDQDDEDGDNNMTEPRSTIHGDVVHSRPVPVNYGGDTGVTVFYGSNDGMLRAVNTANGQERWAFVAPEHFSQLNRLRANTPLIWFPNQVENDGNLPKDYFFDGPIGSYVKYGDDNTAEAAWIFPTMRRGGRMIYAFDVTDPDQPSLLWRKGCPNKNDDTDCSPGFTQIGQTWSIPRVAHVQGYGDGAKPIVIVGGGYDDCEDLDSATVSCGSTKGNVIYVLDAETGALLRSFPTTRAVVGDISLVDVNRDGKVDHAYAPDTGGNIYRIDFVGYEADGTQTTLPQDDWTGTRIAYTNGGGRKFLYGPAVLNYQGNIYLALGSGNRERPLQSNYPYRDQIDDRFYVFIDTPKRVPALATLNLDGDDMFDRTDPEDADCDATPVLPEGEKRGWYMSLYDRGEQTVTSAIILSGLAAFSTNSASSADASENECVQPLGTARSYWVNVLTGSGAIGVQGLCGGARAAIVAGGGLPPSPIVATVEVDGITETVAIGVADRDPEGTGGGGSGSNDSAQPPGNPFNPETVPPVVSPKRTKMYWSSDIDK